MRLSPDPEVAQADGALRDIQLHGPKPGVTARLEHGLALALGEVQAARGHDAIDKLLAQVLRPGPNEPDASKSMALSW